MIEDWQLAYRLMREDQERREAVESLYSQHRAQTRYWTLYYLGYWVG